jgi:hypothetical protein
MKATAILATIVGLIAFPAPGNAQAVVSTAFGSITSLEGGWGADAMAIRHNAPFVNSFERTPATGGARACSVTNAGYSTDPNDPGHSLYHTLAMAAFLNKKDVRLILQGCVFSKPRVVGIEIR